MLLQIQPDESLSSYVRRNLYINRYDSCQEVFKALAKRPSFWSAEVNTIASTMGWPGCHGFNRLIHNHTLLAATCVIKHDQDFSYSQNQYATEGSRYSDWNASFCPDCVKEDLANLGFSYWSRFCSPSVKVCYKHNVVLLCNCPYCGKPFSRKGHTLDVMWQKCNGRSLADTPSTPNYDLTALQQAIVLHGICSSRHHISDMAALRVLRDKAASLIPTLTEDLATKMQSKLRNLDSSLGLLTWYRSNNIANQMEYYNRNIINSISTIYERFEDFLMDLRSQEFDIRPVDLLWATYQAGGVESAHFVEEDYLQGIGRWFCAYPSPLSEEKRSYDGYDKRRPKIYLCCNYPHPKTKGQKLKAMRVGKAAPAVPRISHENATAMGFGLPPAP